MNEYKINTDIISTTGITIDSRNISTSIGKVVINNVEVTDIDSWNKAISTFSELENKINNLQSKIDKAIEFVESMEYCGQEDYFYDNKSKDPCGNDNTFNDSKNKLLDILKKEQPKETKELFEGTMDQLNDLSIFKEDK